MPVTVFTYKGNLPYHASHKLDGRWVDVCLGHGDTITLSEEAQANPHIKNLVKSGFLAAANEPANEAPKPKRGPKPKPQNEKPVTANDKPLTDNNSTTQ